MVRKKDLEEIKLIKSLSSIWEFLAYALKYRLKEILGLIVAGLIVYIVMTVGFNKKDGIFKKATDTKIEVSK